MGKDAAQAVGEALAFYDRGVQKAAAEALGIIGPGAEGHAKKLVEILQESCQIDSLKELAETVVQALASIGSGAAPAVVPLLENRNPDIRAAALNIFGKIGPAAAPQAGDVASCLKDEKPTIRRLSAEVLGAIGEGAAQHAAKHLAGERDERIAAAEALGHIGEAAMPYAVQYMKTSRHAGTRASAAAALGNIGKAAISQASELKVRLKDANPDMRRASLEALTKMGVWIDEENLTRV
eukprot:gnl/MRDRNA2_/MRDRNA2_77499_c1_seq1.p1 gnl/MRDRNA2_/MRDRNA2_77499_c1~~gnl/MRDRNA2_/MRDRNA2_77499_c1_seq1.p1  ORF type:complete len:254 (+),score=76.17 gnl/MRDRNA2_/MRDRNA2_77499_c1_seq1:50-763(+)